MSIVIAHNLILAPPEQLDGADPNAPMVGWQTLVTAASVVADFEDEDYPASNVANPSTAEIWVSTDDGPQYLTFGLQGVAEIDYVGIARHNLGSTTTPIAIEYRVGETDAWTALTDDVILPNDDPVMFRFLPVDAAEVRLRFDGGSLPPEIAVVYIGKLLLLQRNIYVGHVPINYGRLTRVTNGRSESGQFLGRIVTGQEKRSGVSIQNLTPAWYRERMDPFIQAAAIAPFFFSWRPQDYPREIGYCWMTNDPQPRNQRPNGMMEIQLEYGGIAGEAGVPIIAPPPDPEPIT